MVGAVIEVTVVASVFVTLAISINSALFIVVPVVIANNFAVPVAIAAIYVVTIAAVDNIDVAVVDFTLDLAIHPIFIAPPTGHPYFPVQAK